jgi:hypothetical protein
LPFCCQKPVCGYKWLVGEVQDTENPRPGLRLISWAPLVVAGLWLVAQPLIDGLLKEPRWVALTQAIVGIAVVYATIYRYRDKEAAHYRSTLVAARVAHAGSIVYAIRLDPLTTPAGVEWGDSRVIRWGFLRASSNGVEIVRSDGVNMLQRPWSEIEFAPRGIDVRTAPEVEEWWFRVLSAAGPWARAFSLQLSRKQIAKMEELRDDPATDLLDRAN